LNESQALWEELADELEASEPSISRSTMMGLPCLRLDGAFFASLDKRNDELIVKLSAEEVTARVASGSGHSFAPAGKVFREWLAIDWADAERWRAALADALAFARTK
jgi:hypothetical protein